jgi:hypothetical protein
MSLIFGGICFAITIGAVIVMLIYKPKPIQKTSQIQSNRVKVVRAEKMKKVNSNPRQSKIEQAKQLDILHQQFRENKASNSKTRSATASPKKRVLSGSKFRQLTKMVNGQDDVARRLIEGNLKLFPDQHPDWACDKAIADLERDRRA